MLSKDEIVKSVPQKGFFGHPKGLFTLFFTEFWERFSYYGMRAILLYYMYYELNHGGLGLDRTTANTIMAIYGSLVYMSGIIGGYLADRVFGTRKAVFYGGILIMIGHILLSLPGTATMLFASMFFIIIGTGLLKSNVSTIVGDMYTEDDARRDAGFSIFYMGINMGAFLSPLIIDRVYQAAGFHAGFSVAAFGMALGLIVYVITSKKNLGLAGTQAPNPMTPAEKKKMSIIAVIAIAVIVALVFIAKSTGNLSVANFSLVITTLGIVIPTVLFTYMYRSPKTTAEEKSRVLAYIPLFIAAVMFWAIADQSATILATYADTRVNLMIGSFEISPVWFQSLNPMFIIFLAPLFAGLWMKLGSKNPSTPRKFSYALFFAGASFFLMVIPAIMSNNGETLVSPWWLVGSFFLAVIGELMLSPVGLSATTKLAPAAFAGQTMAIWFLASAAASAINAQLVRIYAVVSEVTYFGVLGGFAVGIGIIILIISPIISRAMKGVK